LNIELETRTRAKPILTETNAKQKIRVAIILSRIEQLAPVKVMQDLVNTLIDVDNLELKVFYIDSKVDETVNILVPVEKLDRHNFNFREFDIIHTNGIRPDLLAFINRKKIRYHVSTLHNLVFEDLTFTYNHLISFIFGNIWLLLWNKADRLVCVSEAVRKYYSKWFPKLKLEVIYNGIAEFDSSFDHEYDVIQSVGNFHSSGLKVIGSIGILTSRKGIDQLLYLLAAEKHLALVIIGDGKEYLNLMHLSEKLKISDRCLFCGFRNNASVYLRYFDFFIMPSRSEGFGLALIEAVQQKVPVICSDIPVFKELFTKDEVTFFRLENINSLSLALKEAIETSDIKINLAFRRYKQCYSNQIMAENYYRLYQSCS
jgi:glycosyltransferase involved in cell wall biosynthesis